MRTFLYSEFRRRVRKNAPAMQSFVRAQWLRTLWAVVVGIVLLLVVAGLCAQGTVQLEERPEAYGNTPSAIVPYRSFQEPYLRFFQKATQFLGAGRDEALKEVPAAVRIGLLRPVSPAPDTELGQELFEGVRLAIEQANTTGGFKGLPFELVERPDAGLWGATSNEMVAFKYLDNVLAVIGSIDGTATHVALRVALKTKMAMVNTASTDPTITETALPWILRCMADDRQQGYALAHHIFAECGVERVAAFRVNDRFGRMGIAEFRDAARRLGHPLGVELRWERGDRDFTAQLDRIAETKAQAVVLWGFASDTAAVVRAIRERERRVTDSAASLRIFGCDRLVSPTFLAEAGEAAEGVVAVATYDPTRDDTRLKDFVQAFAARFGHSPGTFTAHAYDGANILITAIRQAGLNRVRIRDALYETKHYDGVTGPIDFDTTLNDVGPVYIATVEQGSFAYRPSRFAEIAPRRAALTPYRTLAESPPAARTPDRRPRNMQGSYRIGCFLPLDSTGEATVRGICMALAEDATRHRGDIPIKLLVRDIRGAWGDDANALVHLVMGEEVLALIGSTERRGTHLAEMLAAKVHFPIVTLCADDPTINQIPLPWVFRVAPVTDMPIASDFLRLYLAEHGEPPSEYAALGYEAARLLVTRIRQGAHTRLALRDALAADEWYEGIGGRFRFDKLGNRIEESGGGVQPGMAHTRRSEN